jgi:4'-phosphopantetheinyl transferase
MKLDSDLVHVWVADLDPDASRMKRCMQNLSLDERERARKFHFRRDRDRFIAARGLLRSILGRYLHIEPQGIRFRYGPQGKPAIQETHGSNIFFNVSHSHDRVLYAIARGREVGIDIELIRDDISLENVVVRFFSTRELVTLRALSPHTRGKAYYTSWVRKEAYMKATGRGLSFSLDQLETFSLPGEPEECFQVRKSPDEASPWHIRDLSLGPDYAAALAVEGDYAGHEYWRWQGETISREFHLA